MPKQKKGRLRVPLRLFLIVPCLLQIFLAVGIVGWLSYLNGQSAVNKLAKRLRTETTKQVKTHIDTQLRKSHLVNQINLDNLNSQLLNSQDLPALGAHFWRQLQIFEQIGVIYYGSEQGTFIAAQRAADGSFFFVKRELPPARARVYTATETGGLGEFKKFIPQFIDIRERPWYVAARSRGTVTWGNIFSLQVTPQIDLPASVPLKNERGNIIGVIGNNLSLNTLGDCLRDLKVGKSGQAFILERNGKLVASSTLMQPFSIDNDGQTERIMAVESKDLLLQGTSKYLLDKFGNFNQIDNTKQLEFFIDRKRHFVEVLPYRDEWGIDWVIVVVVPESEFMGQIYANTRTTILLCLWALIVASIFGILSANWISKPLVRLNQAAKQNARANWQQTKIAEPILEVKELANSFDRMTIQLQSSFDRLKSLNQQLFENKHRLSQVLEALPVGVSIHDSTGQITYFNKTAKQLLGDREFANIQVEQFAETFQIYQVGSKFPYPIDKLPIIRALAGQTIQTDDLEIHLEEQVISLEVIATPIFNSQGQIIYAIATFQDITDRKIAEKKLIEYSTTLEEKVARRTEELSIAKNAAEVANRAKSNFLSQMSHELRTPLNAILGFNQLMQRDSSLTSEQKEHLAIINRNGQHLLKLINEVLDLSKIESGQISLDPVDFDLDLLLNYISSLFAFEIRAKPIQLIVERTQTVPQLLRADRSKLEQILINLLSNAIKFTNKGRVILKVESPELQVLKFTVEDTGVGIDRSEIEKLFIPFSQTESGFNSGVGTGLGLAICKRLVTLMGGSIEIESIPDRGTKVFFFIPYQISETIPLLSENYSAPKIVKFESDLSQYKILIAEDCEENRFLLIQLLTKIGFTVRSAANGSIAVSIWQDWQPHLILMDLQMPVQDGDRAIREIRAKQEGINPKIIVLTAGVLAKESLESLAPFYDDLILKPYQENILLTKIARHLTIEYITEYSTPIVSKKISPEDLKIMPDEWILKLYQLACELDRTSLNNLIKQIPADDRGTCLSLALSHLVNEFNFEEIIELTQLETDF